MNEGALHRFVESICRTARIDAANHTAYQGAFLGKNHRHPDLYQMSYVVGGHDDIILSGRRYRVGPGQLLWLPPGIWHGSRHPDEQVRFELAQAKFSVAMRPNFCFPAIMMVPMPNEWLGIFQQLLNEYHMQRPYRAMALRLLLAQLVLLMARDLGGAARRREKSVLPRQAPASRQAKINDAVRYLHEHYGAKVKLGDVARAVAMSTSTLSHEFRRFTGLAPINYLINYRLSQAVVMMSSAEQKLGTIAEEVGFTSPYYFCRQFKKRYHMSPGKYCRHVYHAR